MGGRWRARGVGGGGREGWEVEGERGGRGGRWRVRGVGGGG